MEEDLTEWCRLPLIEGQPFYLITHEPQDLRINVSAPFAEFNRKTLRKLKTGDVFRINPFLFILIHHHSYSFLFMAPQTQK